MDRYPNNKTQTKRGFTLVELIVSIFIFSIVMTVSLGTLLVLIDADQKGQGIQAVMSNLTFAFDSMTRNIRTGYSYYCDTDGMNIGTLPLTDTTNDCSFDPDNLGNAIIYTDNRTQERVGVRHNPSAGTIERKIEDADWITLTSPDLFVTDFIVTVTGSTESELQQPRVEIRTEGYITSDSDTDPDFQLQANITQRTLDY